MLLNVVVIITIIVMTTTRCHYYYDSDVNIPLIKLTFFANEIVTDNGVKIKLCEESGARIFVIYNMRKRFNHIAAHGIAATLQRFVNVKKRR